MIVQLLDKENIPHERIVHFASHHSIFKFGWQINDFIPGGTVREQRTVGNIYDRDYFPKIGALLQKVHKIKFEFYGSVTNTKKQFSTFKTYTEMELAELHFDQLPEEFSWARAVIDEAKNYADPVLIHDDVNEGNIMWNNGKIILID